MVLISTFPLLLHFVLPFFHLPASGETGCSSYLSLEFFRCSSVAHRQGQVVAGEKILRILSISYLGYSGLIFSFSLSFALSHSLTLSLLTFFLLNPSYTSLPVTLSREETLFFYSRSEFSCPRDSHLTGSDSLRHSFIAKVHFSLAFLARTHFQ